MKLRHYCPYCPQALGCLVRGMTPLKIEVDWGVEEARVYCEPYTPGLGWRPQSITFDVPVEHANACATLNGRTT